MVSYEAMVYPASAILLFAVIALFFGFRRFWSETKATALGTADTESWLQALKDVASLRYLGNDGAGCSYPEATFSNARRVYHQLVMYGFLLCFAATSVAAVYDHVFGWPAPYDYLSLPVALGSVGGIALVIGCGGLFWIKFLSDPTPAAERLLGMDVAFIVLLFCTALSGLLLLALRETAAMGLLLIVHLGFVLGLFLLLPYSKFVHSVYRLAALVWFAAESRGRPSSTLEKQT